MQIYVSITTDELSELVHKSMVVKAFLHFTAEVLRSCPIQVLNIIH